jgi:hypothetical protein
MYLLGWKACFRLADTPGVFHDLDQWIARPLRMVQLEQWKHGPTVFRETGKARCAGAERSGGGGLGPTLVGAGRTRCAKHRPAGKGLFEQMGLPRLASR